MKVKFFATMSLVVVLFCAVCVNVSVVNANTVDLTATIFSKPTVSKSENSYNLMMQNIDNILYLTSLNNVSRNDFVKINAHIIREFERLVYDVQKSKLLSENLLFYIDLVKNRFLDVTQMISDKGVNLSKSDMQNHFYVLQKEVSLVKVELNINKRANDEKVMQDFFDKLKIVLMVSCVAMIFLFVVLSIIKEIFVPSSIEDGNEIV